MYKNEEFGDSLLTYAVANIYEQLVKKMTQKKEFEIYKSLPISDDCLKHNMIIPSGNPAFEAFKAYMDTECEMAVCVKRLFVRNGCLCEMAVRNLYGKFSVLTSPILSQHLLAKRVAKQFKSTLPQQHLSIMAMLNKPN